MSNENQRQHFVCRIIDNGEVFYGIWYTDDADGVAIKDGQMLLWRSEDGAREYARQQQWTLAPDEPATFDLDYISLVETDSSVFQPKDTLDIWNLFSDIGRSLNHAEFSRHDHSASDLHARLSAMSLSHILDCTQGQFTAPEIQGIVSVLRLGKAMLKERRLVLG
jgi:hypothetical protein